MNRRSLLFLSLCGGVWIAVAPIAEAVRLPISVATVKVLSVEKKSFKRSEYTRSARETTSFVARAEILKVVENDHNLSVGAVVEINYDIDVLIPPLPRVRESLTLRPGETITLQLIGNGSTFKMLGLGSPQPKQRP